MPSRFRHDRKYTAPAHNHEPPMPPVSVANDGPSPPGPHPSFIQVANPYIFEATVKECLEAVGTNPSREDTTRIQGVTWLDNVRKALQLPVRTFNTAAIYYHKFRLTHADVEYNHADAAAAALLTACKIEDTLKKSRDILCSAYNLKRSAGEHVSPDDQIFEMQVRGIIGLERLMLESSGFDFRNRHPQKLLMKIIKNLGFDKNSPTARVTYEMTLDLYRTFAPLKQTSATMVFACLELAGRLLNDRNEKVEATESYEHWRISRAEVMETMLDLLELYTHHRQATAVGPSYALDVFLNIRISLNEEAEAKNLPRFTYARRKPGTLDKSKSPSGARHVNGSRFNRNQPPVESPSHINPLTPKTAFEVRDKHIDNMEDGTLRFILDHEQAKEERETIGGYFTVEMEEYAADE